MAAIGRLAHWESPMAKRGSGKERAGQESVSGSEGGREAAVAVLAAHIADLDEAQRAGDGDRWDDVSSDGVEVLLDGVIWEVWLGDDGWTASRPSYESEMPGGSPAFAEGDLIGTVGPATLSAEEIVRRLVTLEFDSLQDN